MSIEKDLLELVENEDDLERLAHNYNTKVKRHNLHDPVLELANLIRFKPRNTRWLKNHLSTSSTKRSLVSDGIQAKILRSFHTDPDYNRVAKEFGLPKP